MIPIMNSALTTVLMVVQTGPQNEGITMLNATDKIIEHQTGLLNLAGQDA